MQMGCRVHTSFWQLAGARKVNRRKTGLVGKLGARVSWRMEFWKWEISHGRPERRWGGKKSFRAEADFERTSRLKERLERLPRETAEVEVELSRADGTIGLARLFGDRGPCRTNWASNSAARCNNGR